MIKFGSQKGRFPQIALIVSITFVLSNFVLAIFPADNTDENRRIDMERGNNGGIGYEEGEVLVKFKPGVNRDIVGDITDSNLLTLVKDYSAITYVDASEYALLKSKHKTTQQLIEELKKLPEVECVSPNFLLHIDSIIPNDPNFSYLWGLHNTGQTGGTPGIDINAPEAWDVITGSSSVIVAVIDTGIDYNHPDLIPNLWVNPGEVLDGLDNDGNGYIDDIHGINAILNSGDPLDDHSHGTHCAGTIGAAGNNNVGVTGVNWNVKLIGAKFMDATGWGEDAHAIECINYLIDLKMNQGQNIVAVNASFGGGDYDPVMESAINAMGAAGIVFCAAAGNDFLDNDITPHYPSSYSCSNIIAVTAVDYFGYQNFNYGATSVDLAAPGIDILSTIPGLYYPQAGDMFFDDMESGAGNWMTGGINNSWAITTEQELFENPDFPVPSPPHFWSDSPGTDYLPDTDSWLMNASDIDLSGYVGQDLFIGFGSAMLFEAGVDHAYVEVSGDSGSTWHTLMDFSEYPIYWYIPLNCLIPDFVKTANFRFRFHLVTDYSWEWPGWLIDDVGIGTVNFYGYSHKLGTSMATPHVTGAVALLAAQSPSETIIERINRILDNVTPLPSLVDTCVTEGLLNLYSSVSAGVLEHTLSISSSTGGTTDPAPGDHYYDLDTPVEVEALADSGYQFSHWTGDVSSGHENDNPVIITMDSNKSISVHFISAAKKEDLLGTWSTGVWYRNSETGVWVNLTTPADPIAAGDLDGDGIADLIGVWSSGLWVQYSSTGTWAKLSVPPLPTAIACGDINGDGRDDIVGSWPSGTFYRDTLGGGWVYVSSSADLLAAGDLDGDGTDDLLGVWSNGLWVKYSLSGAWGMLDKNPPTDIATGDMNGDGRDDVLGTWSAYGTFYRDTLGGSWVYVSTPADLVATGDLDGDGTDDLIGTWSSGSAGLWVKYSGTMSWKKIAMDLPTDIDAGIFNGGMWDAHIK